MKHTHTHIHYKPHLIFDARCKAPGMQLGGGGTVVTFDATVVFIATAVWGNPEARHSSGVRV
jgi:hypothetical protein